MKIHQEQCQVHINRRGSVVTVGTNDTSESSPSLAVGAEEMEMMHGGLILADDEKSSTTDNLSNFLSTFLTSLIIKLKSIYSLNISYHCYES